MSVLEDVYKSEAETNQRNQAIAMLMYAYGRIKDNPQLATDIYTRQCSVGVNAKNLATMARTLANGGRNPFTGKQVISGENVPEIL
ncbi:MAG: glutaminase, partial [Gammaproteobacteria bacterium]